MITLVSRPESVHGRAGGSSEVNELVPRCLQIATGQWCSPVYATWFPVRQAAVFYAADWVSFRRDSLLPGTRVEIRYMELGQAER